MPFSQSMNSFLVQGQPESHLNFSVDFGSNLLKLLNDAKSSGHDVSILSGFRSKDHQARLYEKALEKYGSESAARKYVAPPGNSRHNYGLATDLRYGSDEAKNWVHENAKKYGLYFRMSHEPWHIEPTNSNEAMQAAKHGDKNKNPVNEELSALATRSSELDATMPRKKPDAFSFAEAVVPTIKVIEPKKENKENSEDDRSIGALGGAAFAAAILGLAAAL